MESEVVPEASKSAGKKKTQHCRELHKYEMEIKTLSHTVLQRLKTYGKGQKILNLGRHSNRATSISFVYFNCFAYEIKIGLDLDPVTSSSCCFNINQLFKFPAKIRTLIEGPAQSGIFTLTEDGQIWKLNLPKIIEKEKPPTRYESDDHCKIFGESLEKDVQRENIRYGVNSLFPCTEINQRCKIFCDSEVKDLFVLHKSVILVKQTARELNLHSLAIRDGAYSSIPLLRVSFSNVCIFRNHFNERSDSINNLNLLAPPQNVHCMKFICYSGITASDFTVLRIGHQLFSALFSRTQTLQNSMMLVIGDANGKVFSFPANGIHMEAPAERMINLNAAVNVLLDLQEPVIEIAVTSIREVSFKHRGVLNKNNHTVSENESKGIQNVLRDENVLVVVGRNGKLLLLLAPSKNYDSFLLNQDHISGPITSVLTRKDIIVCSNLETINLYQLSIEAMFEEGKKTVVVPTVKPLHCISNMAAISIVGRNIVPEQKNAQSFLCIHKKGCLCNIVVKEDDNKDSSARGHSDGDMRHLIESLRTSINSLTTSEDALGMQNYTLRHLQIGSYVISETMTAHIEDSSMESYLVIDRSMRLHLNGRITAVAIESSGNLHGSVELCNNTNYPLLGKCLFVVNFISRSKLHNSNFGERIVISRTYLVYNLQPKSTEAYKWSIECCEGISKLPMTVEFKLIMNFPGSMRASASQTEIAKCLCVPLNTCKITILNVLRPVNDNSLLHIPNIHGATDVHRNVAKCSCDPLRPLSGKGCRLSTASLKQTTKQPAYSVSMVIPPLEGSKTSDEHSLQEFFSTFCPELLVVKSVIPSNQLHLQLACKHRVKIARHSRTILLEGDQLVLLLQIQEALCDKIEHVRGTPMVMNLGTESKTSLVKLKMLQREITDNTSQRKAMDDVSQAITNALTSLFKCREMQIP